ncbi:BnaA08g02600D [Brassica napus]|uniref:BnaA08g02600D protein n=1 Tax=Brassica napus TaxID=3708 RepID=A0A078FUK4_BRANA|nr:BnaA08g02600D [Brassica napus]
MSGKTEASAKRVFIGAGCNRVTAQILTTLPGHKASVNCTHWLPSSKFAFKAKDLDRHYLLSGDTDGIIIIWELSTVNNNVKKTFILILS